MANHIAITMTRAGGLDVDMDPRFGRAPVFLIVDRDSGEVLSEIQNDAVNQSHGAGPAAAARIQQEGVGGVISGRFGPKAYQSLDALGVTMYAASPGLTGREALEQLRAGTLEPVDVQVLR